MDGFLWKPPRWRSDLADRKAHVVLCSDSPYEAEDEKTWLADSWQFDGKPIDSRPVIGNRCLAKAALLDPTLPIDEVEHQLAFDRCRFRRMRCTLAGFHCGRNQAETHLD